MRRVLVLRAGALGDLILLRRAIGALRGAGAEVTLLAPAGPGAALVGPGACDVQRLLPWDRAELASLLAAEGRVAPALRGELAGFDAAIAYTRNVDIERNLRELIAPVRVLDPQPPATGPHASLWLASALAGLVSRVPEPDTLEPNDAERGQALGVTEQLPHDFLAIHPGSGSRAKNWPASRFAQLVGELSPGRKWLLSLGPADGEAAELRSLPEAVVADDLHPRVLAAILARAGLFVGNDSGVSHLAAAAGAPTLALFGPTDPALWAPVGPSVATLRAPGGDLIRLELDRVLEAACVRSRARGLPSG